MYASPISCCTSLDGHHVHHIRITCTSLDVHHVHHIRITCTTLDGHHVDITLLCRSGRPSPTTAQHVVDDLGTAVPMVLDGGPCSHGIESTVVDGIRADGVLAIDWVHQCCHCVVLQGCGSCCGRGQ